MLGLDNSAGCHYGDIGDLMVVDQPQHPTLQPSLS